MMSAPMMGQQDCRNFDENLSGLGALSNDGAEIAAHTSSMVKQLLSSTRLRVGRFRDSKVIAMDP
jgi:hypothetical protein